METPSLYHTLLRAIKTHYDCTSEDAMEAEEWDLTGLKLV